MTGFPHRVLRWPAVLSSLGWIVGLAVLLAAVGCGRQTDNAALDSDANGFVCLDCQARFYTDRQVFANHCPTCHKTQVDMVVGFVCPSDGHVTYAPRGRGSAECSKCGSRVSNVAIPTKAELVAWGAVYRTGPEVGVH